MALFLDIETIPQDPEPWMVPDVAALEPPGNYKKAETIAQWRAEREPELVPELRERSSLEPLLGGTVLCVGIAVGDQDPRVLVAPSGDETGELALLRQLEAGLQRYPHEALVAWHGCSFDFPFLAKRALRHGLYSLARRMYVEKPWGDRAHLDPHRAWQCGDARAIGSLKQVARFLGIAVEDEVDGSDVAALYAAGEVDRVKAHCLSDVVLLREVYYRLRAAGWLLGEDEVPDDLPVRPPRVPPPDPREALLAEAAAAQVAATKSAAQAAAEAAGIEWRRLVERGEDGPVISSATTVEQIRTYVAHLRGAA